MSEKEKPRICDDGFPEWSKDPADRVCAICLESTPRATYEQHMTKVHGYTVFHATQKEDRWMCDSTGKIVWGSN